MSNEQCAMDNEVQQLRLETFPAWLNEINNSTIPQQLTDHSLLLTACRAPKAKCSNYFSATKVKKIISRLILRIAFSHENEIICFTADL